MRAERAANTPPDGAKLENAEGVVAGVRYENDDTGYRVIRVRRQTAAPEEVWAGVMPEVRVGQPVHATVWFEKDPRHGDQFRVASLMPVMPVTTDGIEQYIGSGILPGVKAAMARRIVARFGDATLAMLDQEPGQLREVGLGAAKIKAVSAAWQEQRATADIMIFLQTHGAKPGLAKRIFRRYGTRAIDVVTRDPYRLALDVSGIGFETADRIAQSVGIDPNAPERAEAAIYHQLQAFSKQQGQVYTERDMLVASTARELGIEVAAGDLAVQVLAHGDRVVAEGENIYIAKLHAAEVRFAARVREILHSPPACSLSEHVEPAIAEFQQSKGVTLAEEQRAAIVRAAEASLLVITGGPGVGKTTIVRALLALYSRAGLRVALGAPTGRAAKRMNETTGHQALTLHRLLDFDPKSRAFGRCRANPISADVIIIDETSMLDIEIADTLIDAVAGGARVVLVGDVDQLPSVGPGSVLRDMISSGVVPTVRLTRIFRQADGSQIVVNAHRINEGEWPIGHKASDGEFYVFTRDNPDRAADTIIDTVTARIARGFGLDPVRDVQVLSPSYKGAVGVTALNQRLQAALNPTGPELRRGDSIFRPGDKVMQLRNNYDMDVYNGDVGFVVSVNPEDKQLVVRIDEREVPYQGSDLDDLTLAYASTIHKSQGSEYPAVVIPVQMAHRIMLSRNLIYTAVTRGKRLVVLVVEPRALGLALEERDREIRRTSLAARLRA